MATNRAAIWALSIVLLFVLFSCSGPEEKKAKFMDRGQALYDTGEYVKAALEFKNAIQIDPKFARGYYLLGMAEQKQGNFKTAYGALNKAVELDPALLSAQLELGRMLLLGREPEMALEKATLILDERPEDEPALLLKASALLAQKKISAAISVLEPLKEKPAPKPELYLLLASALAQDKKFSKAEDILKEGVAAHPDFVPLHLGLVRFYGESDQPDKAESAMHKVIELEPDEIAYKFNLAELYWKERRHAAAIDTISAVIEAHPEKERVYQAAARFYLGKDQPDQAKQVLEKGANLLPDNIDIRILLGEVHLQQKEPQKAIEVLNHSLTLGEGPADKDILRAKSTLARVYLMMRQPDTADRYADEVLAENPESVEAHLIKGNLNMQRGDGGKAVSAFRVVVSERPGYLPAYLGLASAHLLNKETELAVIVLKDALTVDDTAKEVRRLLARIYVQQRDLAAAEAELRKIVSQHPELVRAQIDLGDFLLAQKKLSEAKSVYQVVTEKAPKHPLAYLRLAQLYRQQADAPAALSQLEAGYAANPLSAPLLTALIQTYVSLKKYPAAEAVCRARIEANERDVFAYNLLGWLSTEQKNYPQAEAYLKKAIDMQPLWPAPHNNLARLYLRQGKKEQAIDRLRSAIRANPKDATGYLTLAFIYEQAEDTQAAMQIYETALKHNPNFWFAANNLAYLISEATTDSGALKRARKLAEKALSLRPDEPAVLDTLAWVFYQQKDYQQAHGLMEQALAAAPDAAILNFHMGMILVGLDRDAEARQVLQKALSSEANFRGRKLAEKTLNELG